MQWTRRIRNRASSSLPVSRLASWLVCAAVLMGLAPTGRANSVVFTTGPRNLTAGTTTYAENAAAIFDVTGDTITVQLLNLQLNPTDVDQAIGSLRFTIIGAGTPAPNATPTGISDTMLGIDSSGVPQSVSGETSTVWRTSGTSLSASAEQISLCAVCSGGTTGLIIGGPDATRKGEYSNALTETPQTLVSGTTAQWIIGSGLDYTGNGSKNHLAGMDTVPNFTITFPGANLSNVVITNVIFGFGFETGASGEAEYGWNTITAQEDAPEPGSMILFGTGLGLVALAAGTRYLRGCATQKCRSVKPQPEPRP
jgi:hypothetical protein